MDAFPIVPQPPKEMAIEFEASRSFCYKFGRYVVLPEIQSMPEVTSGVEFNLRDLAQSVIDKYLTPEQQQIRIKKAQSDQYDPVHSIVKFFVSFIAKDHDIFVRIGRGIFRQKSADDITDVELEDAALADGDEETAEFDGWIYAFSFPDLVKTDEPFPIKIGKTVGDVAIRIMQQCKASASFDNPVVLGQWQVNRVGPTELATHNILKARGSWRENVPGVEWFDTTVAEVADILSFISRAPVQRKIAAVV